MSDLTTILWVPGDEIEQAIAAGVGCVSTYLDKEIADRRPGLPVAYVPASRVTDLEAQLAAMTDDLARIDQAVGSALKIATPTPVRPYLVPGTVERLAKAFARAEADRDAALSKLAAAEARIAALTAPPRTDHDMLPLPTGPRGSEYAVAHAMSGMPKVGRKSIDIHVYDYLRAEVNALRADLARVTAERDTLRETWAQTQTHTERELMDARNDLAAARQEAEALRAALRGVMPYAEADAESLDPKHFCGPQEACDGNCMSFAYASRAVATAHAALSAPAPVPEATPPDALALLRARIEALPVTSLQFDSPLYLLRADVLAALDAAGGE